MTILYVRKLRPERARGHIAKKGGYAKDTNITDAKRLSINLYVVLTYVNTTYI